MSAIRLRRKRSGPELIRTKLFRNRRQGEAWLHRGQVHLTAPPPRPFLARLLVISVRAFALLPLRLVHVIAAAVGGLASLLPLGERRVSEINLRIAMPELDPRARRRLVRRSMIETAKTFAEFSGLWSWGKDRILACVREVRGDEAVRDALRSGRGVIVAAPHLGNWEMINAYGAVHFQQTVLYQRPRLVELESFAKAGRERLGAKLVPAGAGAVRQLFAALKRGEMIAILPDQDAGPGLGIFAPFFGEPANTMMLLSRLAAKTRALVVLGYAERLPRSRGFRVHFVPASEEIYDQDVARSAASMNRDLERCIRSLPEQYLWSYKRYRIRPPGVYDPYQKRPPGEDPPQVEDDQTRPA